MKAKITVGLMLTMLLVGTMFSVLPTARAFAGTIKIGIIGPVGLPHWEPAGMVPAAEIARDEINTAGGVHLPGGDYEIALEFGNEKSIPTPDPDAAALEMRRLIVTEGCQFIIGGFRTEVVGALIDEAMDWDTIFIINGAATGSLLTETVRVDYARYKYLFRNNPVNDTQLFKTIAAYMGYVLIPKLLPIYGYVHTGKTVPQVDVAVLSEDLEWTVTMHTYLSNPAIYPGVLGPYANVTYAGRIPDQTTDFSPWLNNVIGSEARILIHIFSGAMGVPFIIQWNAMNVKAVPVGIDVMGQLGTHWATTGGACEYEGTLAFGGTRTPVVAGVSEVFWDKFLAYTNTKYGTPAWPIYTATGAYTAIYLLKEAIEAAGTVTPGNGHGAPGVITELEELDTTNIAGNFKFTEDHDAFSPEVGPYWTGGYIRACIVQWQAGRMEVIYPIAYGPGVPIPYARPTALPNDPTHMYPYATDVNQDGHLDTTDIAWVGAAFGSSPGGTRWQFLTDVDDNWFIDSDDNVPVSADYGKEIAFPLPYGSEAGHIS